MHCSTAVRIAFTLSYYPLISLQYPASFTFIGATNLKIFSYRCVFPTGSLNPVSIETSCSIIDWYTPYTLFSRQTWEICSWYFILVMNAWALRHHYFIPGLFSAYIHSCSSDNLFNSSCQTINYTYLYLFLFFQFRCCSLSLEKHFSLGRFSSEMLQKCGTTKSDCYLKSSKASGQMVPRACVCYKLPKTTKKGKKQLFL